MKAFRSFHCEAIFWSSESSISTARKSVSPLRQSATCNRSLPLYNSTSSFLIGGGCVFFLPTAVTVVVTGSAARIAVAVKPATASAAASKMELLCLGIIFIFSLSSSVQWLDAQSKRIDICDDSLKKLPREHVVFLT